MAISPGVYSKIIDLGEYVQQVPGTIGFIPIISEMGVDNKLVFTNAKDFFLDFGIPNINYTNKTFGQGPYIASSFLTQSDSLYVVRCLPTNAAWANLRLVSPDATSDPTVAAVESVNTDAELATTLSGTVGACVIFYGVGRGEYYNNFKIKISEHSNPNKVGVYLLDVYRRQENENPMTGLADYEIIDTFEVSFDYRVLDDSGDSMFVEDVVNRYSKFIKCLADKNNCLTAVNNDIDFSVPFTSAPVSLQEGSSGSLFDENGLVDSTTATQILAQAYTGTLLKTDGVTMQEVLDTDNNYFSIVFDGGYPSDVKTAINTLVGVRKDCVGIVDNGDNVSPAAAITARTDTHTFNTPYLALYEPYTSVYDKFTGRDIWVTPVYHMANILPNNDRVAELWYAAAGIDRATIADVKEMRFSPLLGDRDNFYLKQINSIVKFNVYTMWSQLTTQSKPSPMQDLNIVRLVLYIERALKQFCNNYIFTQNDSTTWASVKTEIDSFLKLIQNKRGLYSFSTSVGATEYELKSKKFHVDVTLEPTRTTEQIDINMFIK